MITNVKINALLMDSKDNVVTCVAPVSKGEQIVYQMNGQVCTLTAEEDIPYCHKAALQDFAQGAEVRKYGELIGHTSASILKGHWVSHENIFSVPRDYDSEFI
ncbi:MAG: Galactarate dehydratase (L-threo-forming) [Enterocloster aldenensis]